MLYAFPNLIVRSLLPCDVFLSTTTSKSVHITRYGWWLIHLSKHLSHQCNHLKVSVPFLIQAVCQNSGPNTSRNAYFIFWLENIQGIQSNLILLDSTVMVWMIWIIRISPSPFINSVNIQWLHLYENSH